MSCGNGTRVRDRQCDSPPPELGGQSCSGNNSEIETCGTNNSCIIDGTTYMCVCNGGFTGVHCETPLMFDFCIPNPCQNGGSCTDLTDGFN